MAQERKIRKILYITMSNLGDVLMALPAFDFLRRECPQAQITVVAAPRTQCVFENHPSVDRLIVYDKSAPLRHKTGLFFRLKKEGFDVVVDLKDSFYRWGIPARSKNPAWLRYPDWCVHSSQKHLLKAVVALKGPGVSEEEFRDFDVRRDPSFIGARDQTVTEERLEKHGIAVSLFIDPDKRQIQAAQKVGAGIIELHTGRYADAKDKLQEEKYFKELRLAAGFAQKQGLRVFAGHGLNYCNVSRVAKLPQIEELNIGYSIVCRAVLVGLGRAVKEMKHLI